MPTTSFRFKRFTVQQQGCAMKVNTDGVLLGAWQKPGNSERILDIGTGTGVIALMMAQGNANTQIDAIDIDEGAWRQAKENFGNSPWHSRLYAIHSSLQNFSPGSKYDLIVSNPPYFVNDFKSDQHQKNVARHGIELNYADLILGIKRLLAEDGKALLAIPIANLSLLQSIAENEGIFLNRLARVIAVEGKTAYIVMIQLEKGKKPAVEESITIKDKDDNFTEEYKKLTGEFYLNF